MVASFVVDRLRGLALAVLVVTPLASTAIDSMARLDNETADLPLFDQIIAGAENGGTAEHRMFARAIIDALIEVHAREVEAAVGTDTETAEARLKRQRWKAGVTRYIDGLQRLAQAVQSGATVSLLRESHGGLRLIIGEQQLMVTAPRLGSDESLRDAIVVAVCRWRRCPERDRSSIAERAAERQRDLTHTWEFSANAPPMLASSDGLGCRFVDQRHINLKRHACETLLAELRIMAEGLRSLAGAGTGIDWRVLSIDAVKSESQARLVFDRAGHFLNLPLQHLGKADGVWRDAIPWLRAQVADRNVTHVVTPPERIVYLAGTTKL
jgi:hypothetical protein